MDHNRLSAVLSRFSVGILIALAFVLVRTDATPPHFKRVVVVVLENTDFAAATSQPFLTDLASRGALLTNFEAATHPSQGNYIAMIAGSTYGINHDFNVNLSGQHIGDLLEAKGLGWKIYAEGYPGNCFKGSRSGYVRKHNPFISFTNVQNDPARCARIVGTDQFDIDVANGSLPAYSLYVPNLDNDGHDTGVGFADSWLSSKFSALLNDPNFTKDTLFVVTFDENGGGYPNRVYTALFGPSVRAGATSANAYTHIGLLRTIEDEFALGNLGKDDASAVAITDIWR